MGQTAVAAQDDTRESSLGSTPPQSQGARTALGCGLSPETKSRMKCQLGENFLPFVSCHSWLPIFLRCLQFPRDQSRQAIGSKKKKPSLLLYYLAQYIIIMLENCITFKCVLCIVYYGENSPF